MICSACFHCFALFLLFSYFLFRFVSDVLRKNSLILTTVQTWSPVRLRVCYKIKFSFKFTGLHEVKLDFWVFICVEFAKIHKFKTRRVETFMLFQKLSDVISPFFTGNVIFTFTGVEFCSDSGCRKTGLFIANHIEMQAV